MAKKQKRGCTKAAIVDPDLDSASGTKGESIPPINGRSPVPNTNTQPSTPSLIICRNKYAEHSLIFHPHP